MNTSQSLGQICSLINDIPGTSISAVWTIIFYGLSNFWFVIIPAVAIWIVVEIITRNTHKYNSDNGLTPTFNRFVGGGVFYVFSAFVYKILGFIFGQLIGCGLVWINSIYLIPFIATGLFLHGIGFWPYMMLPIINVKINLFGRSSRW